MNRCTISFDDATINKLQKKAESTGKSVAEIVRNLVDVALEIEQFSDENTQENQSNSPPKPANLSHEPWLQSVLAWTLETRLLTRYLVAELDPEKHTNGHQNLTLFKQRAKEYVDELLTNMRAKVTEKSS